MLYIVMQKMLQISFAMKKKHMPKTTNGKQNASRLSYENYRQKTNPEAKQAAFRQGCACAGAVQSDPHPDQY